MLNESRERELADLMRPDPLRPRVIERQSTFYLRH